MLTVRTLRSARDCDGTTRRDFLRVGESTAKAEVPKSTPIGPQDLMATLFHVLGLPRDLHYNDPASRPVPMLDSGKPIAELL